MAQISIGLMMMADLRSLIASRLAWPPDHGKNRVAHGNAAGGCSALRLVRAVAAFESGAHETAARRRRAATIRKHYERAFEPAWKEDRNAPRKNVDGLAGFVSYEAAQSYLRSAKADAGKLTDEEKKNVRLMGGAVKKLEALPQGAITPLVFSMRPAPSLDALLAPEIAVEFDLRGFGAKERWPWLRADAEVLVWDPDGNGCITSARQMFGGYSWQLFWRDGFEALAALDDNHDGWLRGSELAGISVWFDRDQNAVSDPGEVTPLCALSITGIECAAPERDGPHPLNPRGVELGDGCTLPLWDWIVTPLTPSRTDGSLADENH